MRTYQTKIQSNGKVKRGPIVSLGTKRQHTKPVPDEVLHRIEDAGLVVDDLDDSYTVFRAGTAVAVVWGPAVEGDWFLKLAEGTERIESRDGALLAVADRVVRASRPQPSGGES